MPLYYFHLSFGERMLPDEEGVALPNRAAAREEALAVIQDLSDREHGRRWASWFIDVTDEQGSFLRLPIGYPALEVLPKDGRRPRRAASAFKFGYASVSADTLPKGLFANRSAVLARERLAIRQWTKELLEQNRQLWRELSSEFAFSSQIGRNIRESLSSAQLVGSAGGDPATPLDGGPPPRGDRPRLVLLPGGATD
jgi:hypothetical protein